MAQVDRSVNRAAHTDCEYGESYTDVSRRGQFGGEHRRGPVVIGHESELFPLMFLPVGSTKRLTKRDFCKEPDIYIGRCVAMVT